MIEKSFEKMQTAIPKKILYQLFKEGNPKKYYSQEVDYISILKKELKEYVEKGILSDDSWLKNIFLKNCIDLLHIPTLNSDISIGELDLTIRTYNCLKRANINTLRELMEKTDEELNQLIQDLRKESFNLRFSQATGQLTNTNRRRQVRREIATIKTLQTERLEKKGK